MRYTEIDRRIDAVAAKQFGAFSRQQAFERGASERFVQRRLASRDWIRPVTAVYALARSPGTWKRQCKIAELSVEGSAIAGLAAAALHQLDGFRPGRVELVGPANSFCTHPFATVHRYSGAKLTVVEGIAVTTIAQTLFDVPRRVKPWTVERAMDAALLERRLSTADLRERLTFYEGSRRPGLPRIRPLVLERLDDAWVPPESELEALMLSMLARLPGAPRVVRQASLPWRSARQGRVDALLPDHRLIVEADGRRWHARFRDFDRDRWRDNEAVAHGFRVMRFTSVHLRDLIDDSLDLVASALRRDRAVPIATDG
jgi:very-short-patch-repair endonuclease